MWNTPTRSYTSPELRAELVLDGRTAKDDFALLFAKRQEIEQALGEPLEWNNPQHANMCRLYIRRDADIRNQALWPEQHTWLRTKIESLARVFGPLIKDFGIGNKPSA
jgi:hypothetical protein